MSNSSYTYRFWYKIATYILGISTVLLLTVIVRQNIELKRMERDAQYWRNEAVCYEIQSIEDRYIGTQLIDLLTASDWGLCDYYCGRLMDMKKRHYGYALELNDDIEVIEVIRDKDAVSEPIRPGEEYWADDETK